MLSLQMKHSVGWDCAKPVSSLGAGIVDFYCSCVDQNMNSGNSERTCGFSSRSDKCFTECVLLKTIPCLTNQDSVLRQGPRRGFFFGSRGCLLCPARQQREHCKYHLCFSWTPTKLPITKEGNVFRDVCLFTTSFYGYWFTAHPCYGAVCAHSTGILSLFENLL